MKIATRTKIITQFSIVLVAAFGASLIFSFYQEKKSVVEVSVCDQIISKVTDINLLANDYLFSRSERAIEQWWSVYNEIGRLCTPALVSTQAQKNIMNVLIKKHTHIRDLFSALLIHYKKASKDEAAEDLERRLFSQLLMESQSLFTLSLKLHDLTMQHSRERNQSLMLLRMALFIAMFMVLSVNSFWLLRRLVAPIRKLTKGTEIIGSGDLGYKVGTDAKDEIGQLSRAFDGMTERIRGSYETLKESEEKFRSFLATANDAMILIDNEGNIEYWNRAAEKIFGYPADEVLGKDCHQYLTPERFISASQTGFAHFRDTGEGPVIGKTLELIAMRKDRTEFPVELSVAAVLLKGKWHAIGIARDITERKQTYEQLKLYSNNLEKLVKDRTQDLERSNKDLEQFAYVASHDLQEPLRMVSSYTQLLAERYKNQLDDKAKKFIHYAVDGAVRMQMLINDLLAFSRIGTRGNPLESVDANAVLGEAINNLKMNIAEAKAIITNDELPEVRADASQLVQLFQNLIANAVKFRRAGLPHIHISAKDDGREWLFSVRDSGIGIDPQFADKVFVIFQRLHTKEEYPGSGIGLAICKKIVERHGGRIWFESEPGKGTTFYFTFPK